MLFALLNDCVFFPQLFMKIFMLFFPVVAVYLSQTLMNGDIFLSRNVLLKKLRLFFI